jgi:CheY-like chemotaxis protein
MIMMTANQETSLMGRAFQAGATDFLRKPLNDAELAGRITTAMLLVELTQQERQSRAALQAALSPTPNSRSLAVAERICFSDVDSMMDYYELENHLLRLKDGFYQISVFRIRLPGFERRFRNSTRETTLEELHTVSKKITHAVSAKRLLLTYIGRGRFICCIIGRQSKVSAPFQHRLQNAASEALNALGAESGGDTDFLVKPLNDNPLLAKAVAIDLVRQEFDLVAALAANTPPETLLRKRCLEPGTGPAFVPPHVLV